MIRLFLKLIFSLPLIVVMVAIVIINMKLDYTPERKTISNSNINYDLLKELRGIKTSLNHNADIEMQRLYPEGFVFLNSIYGLAWCNLLKNVESNSEIFSEGKMEIQKAFVKINSDQGRSQFNEGLSLPYGSFYTGWSTYLLGRKLSLEKVGERDQREVDLFKKKMRKYSRGYY